MTVVQDEGKAFVLTAEGFVYRYKNHNMCLVPLR